MNLPKLLIFIGVGGFPGLLSWLIFENEYKWLSIFIFAGFGIFGSGILWKKFGFLPAPPKCPSCGNRTWRFARYGLLPVYSCENCGAILELKKFGLASCSKGITTWHLVLKFPAVIGIWKVSIRRPHEKLMSDLK